MKIPRSILKVAAVCSSLLLASGMIAYKSGALPWGTLLSEVNNNAGLASVGDTAERAPVMLPGSKRGDGFFDQEVLSSMPQGKTELAESKSIRGMLMSEPGALTTTPHESPRPSVLASSKATFSMIEITPDMLARLPSANASWEKTGRSPVEHQIKPAAPPNLVTLDAEKGVIPQAPFNVPDHVVSLRHLPLTDSPRSKITPRPIPQSQSVIPNLFPPLLAPPPLAMATLSGDSSELMTLPLIGNRAYFVPPPANQGPVKVESGLVTPPDLKSKRHYIPVMSGSKSVTIAPVILPPIMERLFPGHQPPSIMEQVFPDYQPPAPLPFSKTTPLSK